MKTEQPQPQPQPQPLRPNPVQIEELDAFATTFDKMLLRFSIDTESSDTLKTPLRYVKALHEMTRGLREPCPELTTFLAPIEQTGKCAKVTVSDIPFNSLCEHHLLPYFGHVTISYRPYKKMLGLSKFARLVEWVAARPSTQEVLTQVIATNLGDLLGTKVTVSIAARHTCAFVRGAKSDFNTLTKYTYKP